MVSQFQDEDTVSPSYKENFVDKGRNRKKCNNGEKHDFKSNTNKRSD